MPIHVALNHKTTYRYPRPVWLSPHLVRLHPAPHCRTPILSYTVKVTPEEHFINWQQDPYNNRLARLVFPSKAREFSVEVDLIVEMTAINPFDFFVDPSAEKFPFVYDSVLTGELTPYFEKSAPSPELTSLVAKLREEGVGTVDYLVKLNSILQTMVSYVIRLEPGIQAPEQTLKLGTGSCRDSAWLMVQLLREMGLAARFVSGYLIQLKPDVKSLDGPSGAEKDFTDLHAWCEVYLPGAGWVGMDPTSGLLTGEGHIPLASSANPGSASPITGYYSTDDETIVDADPRDESGEETTDFAFHMSVTRIHEDPRVTKPYTPDEWNDILALGHKVDDDLLAGDVRLTMGGEPTFVSIDDMDGPEWNLLAQGPNKRRLADELIKRLRGEFAPKGLLHYGQGKWYPGEPLPRWAFTLLWRKDGQPIWKDPSLVADEQAVNRSTAKDAAAFMDRLTRELGVNPKHAIEAFEDSLYYMWKERRLPVNVDLLDNKLENKEDRARIAKIFEQGLSSVIGLTLPLRRAYVGEDGRWTSGAWYVRPERMYLLPGDSPMGYRLPLDSLAWVAPSQYPHLYEQDPLEPRHPLPSREELLKQLRVTGTPDTRNPEGFSEQYLESVMDPAGRGQIPGPGERARRLHELRERTRQGATEDPNRQPAVGESAPWIVRTALCVEPRGGILHVFMPPVKMLEDYLEIITAVESSASALGLPVRVEGYLPPSDPRIQHVRVTPDPGVIEVNLQPAASWDELVHNTSTLYEQARLTRLGTEKFMLDGRHTGTGGGNHIIVGGPTPADSPILRRPDLLQSLVSYWHNHPALSYLFSGQFVGPTSQAPRIDEARNDALYEMEIAFKEVPRDGGPVAPWLVDRIFRNLLVDVSGNTHRAEFCIDKLYSPDSSAGRLGLLEMRAFEMPPHWQMSMAQHLLLRSLLARFWKNPYQAPLVRWGTELHDKFMLPHFVQQDLSDVLLDLKHAGYPMQDKWFDPHLEFRFPTFGTTGHRGVEMELRQAIEPWHVMGEETAGGGVVRYVDSSVERLQIKVRGMTDTRHVVTCNGRRVPLHPTGRNGEFVAGVRFRAWQPGACLHPTIGVHSPLTFDVVDSWQDRSLGGCTYHVAHPAGRSYEQFPVNSLEAEARRVSRFTRPHHTPGKLKVAESPLTLEQPITLDLRT